MALSGVTLLLLQKRCRPVTLPQCRSTAWEARTALAENVTPALAKPIKAQQK